MLGSWFLRGLAPVFAIALMGCCGGDMDGDGICDRDDNCPGLANPSQEDFDHNGVGDVCDDYDGDGVPDASDNCRTDANSDQADTDMDGIGDVCDPDMDGDGVDNSSDLCPGVADPDQHDEDRDRVGDVCDNCPTVVNPGQEDFMDGGDGVGDACDPRPLSPGDSIAFFAGFARETAGVPAGWRELAGPGHGTGVWYVARDRLVQQRTDMSDPASLFPEGLYVPGPGVLIDTLVTVDALPQAADASLGLVAGPDQSAAAGYACALETLSGLFTRIIVTELRAGGAQSQDRVVEWELTPGRRYRLTQYHLAGERDSTVLCQAVLRPGGRGRVVAHVDPYDNRPAQRLAAVRTRRAAASFDYVLVYSLGGPVPCSPPDVCL